MRQQLEAQKRQFLGDLNRQDPNWQQKIKQRQKLEIQRMEETQKSLQKDIKERKSAVKEAKDQQEALTRQRD